VKQLIKLGEVQRGWLGVHIQVVTEPIAEALGLKKAEGALVASVIADGPAAKAGIKPRDVILEFDGKRVVEMRQLPRIVAATEIDRAVKVKVWRDGKAITLNASIAKMDEGETVAAIDTPQPGAAAEAEALTIDALGIGVSAPSAALRDRFELLDSVDRKRGV